MMRSATNLAIRPRVLKRSSRDIAARICSRRGFSSIQTEDDNRRTALVLGSSGATGSTISRYLSQDLDMCVYGADLRELPSDLAGDWELDGFVPLDGCENDLPSLTSRLAMGMNHLLAPDMTGLDVIVCASGGWEGDPAPGPQKENEEDTHLALRDAYEYAQTIERMRHQNLDPVLAAAYLTHDDDLINPNCLFVVLGATAALSPTPGMLGYGLAKVGAHHLVQTLGACTGGSLETKPVRQAGRQARKARGGYGATRQSSHHLASLTVVGILPTMIDTPSNRRNAPSGTNFDALWTKPHDIAEEIGTWVQQPRLRPHSGSLIKVHPTSSSDGGGPRSAFTLVR